MIITRFVFLSLLSFLLTFATSCQQKVEQQQPLSQQKLKYDVPPLMERSPALAAMPEWTMTWERGQNIHQKFRLTGDPKAGLSLAALYMQEARITGEHPYYYNAALDILNIIIDHPPKEKIFHYQALVSKASVMLSQHQFKEALEIGQQALQMETKDAQVYGILCDANVELGQYDKAVAMADKMVSIKPDLRSYARISYLRELHGEVEGAIEAMQMAVKAGVAGQEGTAWARNTLANLYLEYGYVEEAKQQVERCLVERTDFPFALATKATIELHQDNIDKAAAANEKAMNGMPEFSFYITKAKIQELKGEKAAYESTKTALLEMMKEDTESGHNMSLETGRIYLDLFNDPAKALEVVQPEYEKRADNIEVNILMGTILYEMGKYQKALAHFEKASRTNCQKPDLICLKAMTLHKTGTPELAIQQLKNIDLNTLLDKKIEAKCKEIIASAV